MGIGEWGDERDLLVGNGHPRGAELLDDATHVDGVPHQNQPSSRFPHSPGFSGKGCRRSSKASRRENLEVEEPVTCRDGASFDFHATLASMLGPTLIWD